MNDDKTAYACGISDWLSIVPKPLAEVMRSNSAALDEVTKTDPDSGSREPFAGSGSESMGATAAGR